MEKYSISKPILDLMYNHSLIWPDATIKKVCHDYEMYECHSERFDSVEVDYKIIFAENRLYNRFLYNHYALAWFENPIINNDLDVIDTKIRFVVFDTKEDYNNFFAV